MACLKQLKRDLEEVNKAFPANHPRFRVDASIDEVKCTFVIARDGRERLLTLSATIPEEYPRAAPIWYLDDESGCEEHDATIASSLIEKLPRGTPSEQNVRTQISALLCHLCSAYNVPMPTDLRAVVDALGSSCSVEISRPPVVLTCVTSSVNAAPSSSQEAASDGASDDGDANENDDDLDGSFPLDDSDDEMCSFPANDRSLVRNTDDSKYSGTDDDYVGVDRNGVQLLEGLRHRQRDAHLHGKQRWPFLTSSLYLPSHFYLRF